jgi:ATP-dependent Clp protease ATP-binding subunit ClpA
MGPFDRFNDRAKRVIALAQADAIRFNHNYIGTEHLLLAMVREGEGIAGRVLISLGLDQSKVREAIMKAVGPGHDPRAPTEIILAPDTKKVFELAIDEMRKLGVSHVGTEHLLLGIVRLGETSTAAKLLASLGVELEKVRHATIAWLGQAAPAAATWREGRSPGMGPFDRFNDRSKRVLALAQDEAIRFNHNYIGTEHLLLGLIREGEGVAARVLDSLGVELSMVRRSVEFTIGRGDATTSPSEITLNPPMKKAIELAIDEARKLGHSHVGTEHLLLGIVRQGESVAAKVLGSLGVDLEKVRHGVIAELGQQHPPTTAPAQGPQPSTVRFTGPGGPFERFNDPGKRVLALAQEEAVRLKHNYIGTEHLLLGLVLEGQSAAARALASLGVELSKVRTAVEFIIGPGDAANMPSTPDELTISPRTKKVIEFAFDEARLLNHRLVGPEHLLLGLVREGQGIASGVIESLGVTLAKVRQQLLATLGQTQSDLPTNVYSNTLVVTGPFDLLDDGAKRVLAVAEEEARQMRHNWIGTEHMMIALLRADGIAQRALQELGVKIDEARAGVFKAVPPRETDVTEITVTPRVKTLLGKAITLAAPTADRVKPQHLLLALVADPDGIGSQVLAQLGVTNEKVREAVDRLSAG